MELTLLGAARTVTGSMYLLSEGDAHILLDAGMFQGEMEEASRDPLPLPASRIQAVILTHAHQDHIGRLPMLVRQGFRGEIFSTAATRDLARIMLLDAAHVQEEDLYYENRRRARAGLPPLEPLYELEDVLETFRLPWHEVPYGQTMTAGPFTFTFRDAGHILGSAFVEFETPRRLVFSGDLGNRDKPIVRDPDAPVLKDPEAVFLESTYGGRNHRPFTETRREFLQAIQETLDRGGNVLIPTFALERAQEILYVLREFKETGDLPASVPVFLDSPLAIDATRIFLAHPECFDREALDVHRARGRSLFQFPGLQFTRSVRASQRINEVDGGAIILAGSGMMSGGRIKHHLKHHLWKEQTGLVVVGYQARGTLGRKIVEGAREVQIFGEPVAVRARVYTINGFSAHAGQNELLAWSDRFENRPRIFLVHGEEDQMEILRDRLIARGHRVDMPHYRETLLF